MARASATRDVERVVGDSRGSGVERRGDELAGRAGLGVAAAAGEEGAGSRTGGLRGVGRRRVAELLVRAVGDRDGEFAEREPARAGAGVGGASACAGSARRARSLPDRAGALGPLPCHRTWTGRCGRGRVSGDNQCQSPVRGRRRRSGRGVSGRCRRPLATPADLRIERRGPAGPRRRAAGSNAPGSSPGRGRGRRRGRRCGTTTGWHP